MRIEIGLVCATVLLAGCLHHKPAAPDQDKKKTAATRVTPSFASVGRVEMVNTEARFVVLSFPPDHVPQPGQRWRINHRGLKIGEVKISGPQREMDTVADIIEGEANVGDEATPK